MVAKDAAACFGIDCGTAMSVKGSAAFLIIIYCCAVLTAVGRTRHDECPTAEEYAVFTALFPDSANSDNTSQIVIEDKTVGSDLIGDLDLRKFLKDLQPLKAETIDDFLVRNQVQCKLIDHFDLKVKVNLVSAEELRKIFNGDLDEGWKAVHNTYPGVGAFQTLSRVGFSKDHNQALVYFPHFCGSLCGQGEYFVLEKIEGKWRVKNRIGSWIS